MMAYGPTLYAYVFQRPFTDKPTSKYVIYAHSEKAAREIFKEDWKKILKPEYEPKLIERVPW